MGTHRGVKCLEPKASTGRFPPARCRRCAGCLNAKRWDLITSVIRETAMADRSVVLRLSFRPRGKFWRPSWSETYPDFQKWAKLVRDRGARKRGWPPGAFRYFVVGEFGDLNGRFHLHVVAHGPQSMSIALLRGCWKQGQTHGRTVQSAKGAASYVSKYLAKDQLLPGAERSFARSNGYGSVPLVREVQGTLAAKRSMIDAVYAAFPHATVSDVRPAGVSEYLPSRLWRAKNKAIQAERLSRQQDRRSSAEWASRVRPRPSRGV